MIKIEKEKEFLDKLRQYRMFISTHECIRNFSDACILNKEIIDFDYSIFTSKTQENLKKLSNILNWKWKYIIEYNVNKVGSRCGYFVYGVGKNQRLVNFHRKETRSRSAGQTIIHIETKDLQIHRILKNEFRGEKELILLRKLMDMSDGFPFEKMMFERI